MKILITGINGFVGSNITPYLKTDHIIYGLDIVSKPIDGVNHTYNWNQIHEISEIDAIIHLTGKAHDTENASNPKEYFDVNVGLTKTIFDHFLESEARIFIFFSSVKAVADTVKNQELTEDDTPDPKTPYGQSKLEAEQYILSQPNPKGKLIYILRPAMIHGPGNKGNLNLLYKLIDKGIPYPLGSFHNQRSFMSIGNLNFIISNLIEKQIPSGIYQVADTEPLSTNEIIKLIAVSTGKKSKIWNVPKLIIKLAASIGDLIPLPINSEKVKKLTENYLVSNKKITTGLGLKLPVTASEGLKVTLSSFQKSNQNKK